MKKMLLLGLLLTAVLFISSCTLPYRARPGQITPTVDLSTFIPGTQAATAAETDTGLEAATQPVASPPTNTATPAPMTVTPLPATATSAPTPTATQPAPTEAAPSVTIPEDASRIQLAGGRASIPGTLEAGETEHFVLEADAGQTIEIEVWSPNGDVYLSLTGAANGDKLLDASQKSARFSGGVTTGQDYLVSVVAGGGTTSYTMEVVHPSQAGTTQPTARPTSQASAPGTFDPYKTYGNPDMVDNMNGGNRTAWVDAKGNYPNTDNIRLFVENSKFYVTGKQPGFSTWWFSWPELEDFFIELTVETGACSGDDAYGLILRGPEHGAGKSFGYVVSFSCDGSYRVFRLDSADPFTAITLVDWTKSEHITTGSNQQNVMGIKADGDEFVVYANNHQLVEVSDDTYREGRYGLFVSPVDTVSFTYRAVKLAYWLLD